MAAPACNDGTCDTNVKATYMICSNVPSLSSLCWLLNSSLSPGRQSFTFSFIRSQLRPQNASGSSLVMFFYLGPSFGRFTGLPSCEQTHRKTQNPFETYINTEPPTPTRYYYSCLATPLTLQFLSQRSVGDFSAQCGSALCNFTWSRLHR